MDIRFFTSEWEIGLSLVSIVLALVVWSAINYGIKEFNKRARNFEIMAAGVPPPNVPPVPGVALIQMAVPTSSVGGHQALELGHIL